MKKFLTCLLTMFGLTTACGQQNYENTDVKEGHLEGAVNIDQAQGDFIQKAKAVLPKEKTIAVYCRSGRRSANAAGRLADEGYKCVNLKGGIIAWKEANEPVTMGQ